MSCSAPRPFSLSVCTSFPNAQAPADLTGPTSSPGSEICSSRVRLSLVGQPGLTQVVVWDSRDVFSCVLAPLGLKGSQSSFPCHGGRMSLPLSRLRVPLLGVAATWLAAAPGPLPASAPFTWRHSNIWGSCWNPVRATENRNGRVEPLPRHKRSFKSR